ncbi:exostosin family protein [Candidatus Beckwithbacteria bacterium]|nr:exostosin family protein [Candidatus Beckwithbacteria bacterium]
MKIYILPINKIFQPEKSQIIYPSYNQDYGVEQDFLAFLIKNSQFLTENQKQANWHYLPIFWTRYFLNNNYSKNNLDILKTECQQKIIDDKKTFTICQYDDGPLVALGKTRIFLSARKTEKGNDIPLLAKKIYPPFPYYFPKKYLASFVGRINTHPIRKKMTESIKNKNIKIIDQNLKFSKYKKILLQSYISLCPRGYGGNSFRFYESMQLGVVPLLISDIDNRPFKNYIGWDQCSLFFSSSRIENINQFLEKQDLTKMIQMGKQAKKIYKHKLEYQKWCQLLINELE